MIETKNKRIGIFGGSFDPPHIGHLTISKISLQLLGLKKIFWVITKKNPFKDKPFFSLRDRINKSKKLVKTNNKIKIVFLDNKIRSSRTINIIKHYKKKNKKIYLIVGSDNLINFKKWTSWKSIVKACVLLVFSRKGFDKKAKKSAIVKYLKNKNIIFIKNKKINISSSKIRNIIIKKNINGNISN